MPKIPTAVEVERAIARSDAPLPEVPLIDDNEDYGIAGESLKLIKRRQRELDDLKKTMTRPLDEAKRAILALFDPALTRLTNREMAIKNAIREYDRRLEDNRRLLEAKLREEQAAEAAKLEARAERLRARGHEEQAGVIIASIPPLPVVIADKPSVSGISSRSVWRAEVTDLWALAQFCLDQSSDTDLNRYLEPNMAVLHSMARSLKDSLRIPGVRAVEEKTVVARA